MLASKERLDRDTFTRVFKVAKRAHSAHLTLLFTPDTTFKAAVVVSKKVAKKAVDRNTLKRRLYGVLEVYKDNHFQVIIITKPGTNKVSRQGLASECSILLAQNLITR